VVKKAYTHAAPVLSFLADKTGGKAMTEEDRDSFSLTPDGPTIGGPDAAEEGMEIYQASTWRRRKSYYALWAVAVAVLGLLVWQFVENTRTLIYILFAGLVSFGSAMIYLSRGLRKYNQRLINPDRTGQKPMVLAVIVIVAIVVGIPALVLWLYTKISVPS
jgi:hypothetical protein